tara:strand:+ start:138 stop:389 length:252 start_codon:yes stop_codon:yes gene_type:complete
MNIISYIDFKWFLISFSIGLLLVYCTLPKPDIIIKFPTPVNSDFISYKDEADNCFKYKTEETDCPADKSLIKTIPIQYNPHSE